MLVATADGRVRSLAARDLSPDRRLAARRLDRRQARWGSADGGLAMDRAGGILAFGRDGQKTWSIKLGAEVVGAPQVVGRSLVILTSDGVLHLRARSDGAAAIAAALGSPAGRRPDRRRPDAMIPVAPGTVRPLALEMLAQSPRMETSLQSDPRIEESRIESGSAASAASASIGVSGRGAEA